MVNNGPEERKRTGGVEIKPKSSFADLMSGNLALQISLSAEDRDSILNQLNEIGDKVDYRWKNTQRLMGLAIVLGVIGEGVKYL